VLRSAADETPLARDDLGTELVSDPLRAELEAEGARIHLHFPRWLRPFLSRNVEAITLGRRIYLRPGVRDRSVPALEALLRHELVHVRQAVRLGLPLFLLRYTLEYIHLRLRGRSGPEAYREISFEREAFEEEEKEGHEPV
jgi:hypothetical protein